jgi:hypothetical protein
MARGTCVCGAVEFDVQPPYRFFQYCHCRRCRKRSGSLHAANILVADAQLAWVRGEDLVRTFSLPSAKVWNNAFCSVCGSGLPWRPRGMPVMVVPAGSLDDPPAQPPTRNVWTGSRASWHVDAATLPCFDEEAPRG